MTDDLVERLRWGAWYYEDPFDGKAYASDDPLEAADLIETQAREIERLRERITFVVDRFTAAENAGYRTADREFAITVLTAALAGESHDR